MRIAKRDVRDNAHCLVMIQCAMSFYVSAISKMTFHPDVIYL